MSSISPGQLLDQLYWRYAVKLFDPNRKIPQSDWEALEKSLILTPSSYGLQLWKFIVIQDLEIRKKLTAVSWNQKQVENCSHYVVFTYRTDVTEKDITDYAERMSEIRETPMERYQKFIDGAKKDLITGARSRWVKEWSARQTYIALGNFMTCAALIGVDTCPMEGLEPEKYDEILGLKGSGFETSMACAAGYRHLDDRFQNMKKVRFPTDRLVKNL